MKNNVVTKAIDLYVDFWGNVFNMLLDAKVDDNGQVVDISNDMIIKFFDNVNGFVLSLKEISLEAVALSTIYETLFLFMNDMEYVSKFTQDNSKKLRALFGKYLMSFDTYKDFRDYLMVVLDEANAGFMEVKITLLSVFGYFLNKEKYLFNKGKHDVEAKLNEIKLAVDNGVNPVIELYPGMSVSPFFNGKIIDLMKEISSVDKNVGGKFGDFYINCKSFRDEFFGEFRRGLYMYRDSGFQLDLGLGQDVESCRAKLVAANIKAYCNVTPEDVQKTQKNADLYKKLIFAESQFKLGDSTKKSVVENLKNQM